MKLYLSFAILLLMCPVVSVAQVSSPLLSIPQKRAVEKQLEDRYQAKFWLRGKSNLHEHISDVPKVKGLDLPLSQHEAGALPENSEKFGSVDKARAHIRLCQPGLVLAEVTLLDSASQLSDDKTLVYTLYKFRVRSTIFDLSNQLSSGQTVLGVLPGGEIVDAGEKLRVHTGPLSYAIGRTYVIELHHSEQGVYLLNFGPLMKVRNATVTFPTERFLDVRSGSQIDSFRLKLQREVTQYPCANQ